MKSTRSFRFFSTGIATLVLGVSMSAGARAIEPATPPNDADAKLKTLEERVKQLEKRLGEMEANAAKKDDTEKIIRDRDPLVPKAFGMKPFDDFNAIADELRRRMEQGGTFGQVIPLLPNGAPFPNGAPQSRGKKLSMGVAVAEISDDLKTRFKNDVLEGVFVISVAPKSPAAKAGVLIGDVITEIDGKAVANPKAFVDMVKAAGKGNHEIMVARRGELLKLKVELEGGEPGVAADPVYPGPANDNAAKVERMEIKVSALELPDALAKDLKLSDEQKTKVSAIFAKHAKLLSDEFAKSHSTNQKGDTFGFTFDGSLDALAKKHVDNAAAELKGILSDAQMKQWNDYRAGHFSISFSHSVQMKGVGGGGAVAPKKSVPKEEEDDGAFRF